MEELLSYTASPFQHPFNPEQTFPLKDEPHLEAWREYSDDAVKRGVFEALKRRLPQLNFPIMSGISKNPEYQKVTRQGLLPPLGSDEGLVLECPYRLELVICSTMAGSVPVLVAGTREDFVALVQALSARNEPVTVPNSMGACLVTGYNNWDRIRTYRRLWEHRQSKDAMTHAWKEEFRLLVPRKELYQDRFIILSRGPYSAVPAISIGLDQDVWLSRSLELRREHELTHYFTYRLFGMMQDNLLDEILADFVGLIRSFGSYERDLALLFFGLEKFPQYREGARLENYRGKPPLSRNALDVMKIITFRIINNLSDYWCSRRCNSGDLVTLAKLVLAVLPLSMEELASNEMLDRVEHNLL